ncbi:hypothetical protein MXD62_16745 [Frankia sp. Mgl5]|uniref:phage tail tube protein n=1 Tax=Frankia sp. Mgl5 TaxID=2933793 RepID=UPI00200BE449|nr:hypothetical protein [Frankia sp. Mgl5]MCK9928805.1 hypothetical protein [Frankia sp. Mgl5]
MAEDVTATRGAVLEIESAVTDTWLDLTPLIESLDLDRGAGTQRQAVDAWGDEGWQNDRVTGRGWKFSVTMKTRRDLDTGAMNAAQARISELGDAQLAEAQTRVRYRESADLATWLVWGCNVDVKKSSGGGAYDLAPLEFDIMTCGAPDTDAVV